MARIIICCLVICLAVLFSEACHPSGSGYSPDREEGARLLKPDRYDSRHSQGVPGDSSIYGSISPNYNTKSGELDITTDFTITRGRPTPPALGSWWLRDRRDVDSQKDSIFKMIDMNGNQYIEICEWVEEGGSAINFVAFLSDDDTDGDEKISWQEFQAVNV